MSLAASHPTLPVASESGALRLRHALSDGVAIARRNLTHVRYVPEKLLDVTSSRSCSCCSSCTCSARPSTCPAPTTSTT